MSAAAARARKDPGGDNGLNESRGAVERTYGDAIGFAHRRGPTQIQEVLDGKDSTGLDSGASRSLLAAPSGAREQ